MKIKQQKIPISIRRTAARHLESIRDTRIGLNSQDLYLSDSVVPIYRPDLKQPAYYEFHIINEARSNVDNRKDLTEKVNKINIYGPSGLKEIYGTEESIKTLELDYIERFRTGVQGFIIVSSGKHDFPITHWSLESEPPSQLLNNLAVSQKLSVAKVYKVDALSYIGEDKKGKEVASLGQRPSLISGLQADLSSSESQKISSAVTERKATRHENDSFKIRQGKLSLKGPKPKDFKFTNSTWEAIKKNFEKSFKPLMNQLQISASEVWEKEKMIEEFGEGIIAGDRFYIPVLEKDFTVELSGDASKFTVLRVVKRSNSMSAIELTTKKLPVSRELDLSVEIRYGKSSEMIRLFVVNPDSPTESINNLKNEE